MTGREVTLVPWERNPELLWEVETLAQQMAEAILAKYAPCAGDGSDHQTTQCSDHTANWPMSCDFHENAPSLYDVAKKLRAIGGNHA